MGTRGKIANPVVRELKGTARRTTKLEPPVTKKAAGKCPTVPSWLDEAARREWDEIVPSLWKLGRLDPVIDLMGLAALSVSIAKWRKAELLLSGADLVLNGKPNPALKIARDALAEVLLWSREFGCTVLARARLIDTPIPPGKEKSKIEKFLSG